MTQTPELPRYKCHKEVQALKIQHIWPPNGSTNGELTPEDFQTYGAITIDEAYFTKHNPEVGGYFVVYEDGYQSYSPAKAFESGYTRIDQD